MKKNEVEITEEKMEARKITRTARNGKKRRKLASNYKVLFFLMILVALELCMIPCFVYAGMNQIFPVIMFLIIPTIFAIIVFLLSKNTLNQSIKNK